MKICIVGAGAIGGFIGTKLAATGAHQVSTLARGDTLAALQKYGWRLQTNLALVQAPVHKACGDAAELGVQDLIIIAVKCQALADVAPTLAPLLHGETMILPAMNGVPWWFMNKPLQSIDPKGLIQNALPVDQVLGCVVHASISTASPGLSVHHRGQQLIIGESLGGASARLTALISTLSDAGFEAINSSNIRLDIWYKLWGNMTMNPISAMTGATVDRVLADPMTRAFCSAVMQEAQIIGMRIDCPIAQSPEERHAVTAKLGAVKPSMLQDVEAGRRIELDAILGAVQEIGQRLNIQTPNIDALFGLARLFAQTKQLYD